MADNNTVCVDCEPSSQQEKTSADLQQTTHLRNPLDPSTFIPPTPSSISPSIIIEFCDRCRWLHRATWVSTELFLTFPTPAIKSVTILPLNAEDTAGRFRVWLFLSGVPPTVVWDRKIEGGFPELKVLKQRIRDHIQPGKSLGHSDK
ncbi:Rdx family-domain-containing protein [Lenzites betulinus]|nr:Rdx family-domain-containing protein [Lenzites betulinus]